MSGARNTMGCMKQIEAYIRMGGDDAIAAACELSDLAKERRGYEDTMNATGEITDIVTVLRGVGFAAVSPEAGDSASLLHYCVTHAADEIERLRQCDRSQPVEPAEATPDTNATPDEGSVQGAGTLTEPLCRHPLCQDSSQKNLTASERFVLNEVRDFYADIDDVRCNEIAAVIEGLLERTQ